MTLVLPYGPMYGVQGGMLRHAAQYLVSLGSAELYDLCVALGQPAGVVEPIWRQLQAEGYIAQTKEGQFVPTAEMWRLCTARFGNRLSRDKARGLLERTIANAKLLNSLPDEEGVAACMYYVTRLVVFGSFLDETRQELGDLDLAWDYRERPGMGSWVHHCIMYNRDSAAPTRGRLVPRGGLVRLTTVDDLEELECASRVVYEFDNEVLAARRARRE